MKKVVISWIICTWIPWINESLNDIISLMSTNKWKWISVFLNSLQSADNRICDFSFLKYYKFIYISDYMMLMSKWRRINYWRKWRSAVNKISWFYCVTTRNILILDIWPDKYGIARGIHSTIPIPYEKVSLFYKTHLESWLKVRWGLMVTRNTYLRTNIEPEDRL